MSLGVVATLKVLTRAIGAKAVVEVGTMMGSSGLAFLGAMGTDGILTSIDVEADNQLPARKFFTAAGFPSSRFRLIDPPRRRRPPDRAAAAAALGDRTAGPRA